MVDSFGSPYADQADVSFQRKIDDGFRNMATTAVGRELEVAFVESCRSIGAAWRASEWLVSSAVDFHLDVRDRLVTRLYRSPDRNFATGCKGSGCDNRPIGFIAGKPALKVRCPQAATRR